MPRPHKKPAKGTPPAASRRATPAKAQGRASTWRGKPQVPVVAEEYLDQASQGQEDEDNGQQRIEEEDQPSASVTQQLIYWEMNKKTTLRRAPHKVVGPRDSNAGGKGRPRKKS